MTNIELKRKIIAGGIIVLMLGCTACSLNENTVEPLVPSNVTEMPQTTGENSQQPQSAPNNRQEEPEDSETSQNQENPQEPENHSLDWYFENVDLTGDVVDFSEDGFTLVAAITSEDEAGGQEAVIAVPGEEDQDSLVTVSYSENVIFEVITIDAASNTMISKETVDKETVKKQSSVLIFGICQNTRNWIADRVVITRWSR